MAGRDNFNWTEDRQRKLKYAVHNYNRRLERFKKEMPEMEKFLPERAFISDLKKDIKDHNDLRRTINKLERFTRDSATDFKVNKEGYAATAYEVHEVKLAVDKINREKAKRREKIESIEATTRGQPTGLTRGQMGSEELNSFRATKFNFKEKTRGDWEAFKKTVEKQSSPSYFREQDERLRNNYITGLYEACGNTSEVKELAEYIKSMNIDDFIEVYFSDEQATIGFYYDPIDVNYKLEVIKDIYMYRTSE